MQTPSRILISRTDSIGDVILTLPMAGVLKAHFPETTILFLGRSYTQEVVALSAHVDEFVNWDQIQGLHDPEEKIEAFKALKADVIIHVFPQAEIAGWAKKAKIANRIGTSGRLYHYKYCNELVRFSRRRSNLHEAQLNLKLLRPLNIRDEIGLAALPDYYGLTRIPPLDPAFAACLDPDRVNIILHPKSKGSAREWGLANFLGLIQLLPREKYHIILTGTAQEGISSRQVLMGGSRHITDLTGKMSLGQLVAFIHRADGLIAASTGPLHIAAALGIYSLGIYPPIKPMHPGRWAPLGTHAHVLVKDKNCHRCRKKQHCACMESISPEEVKQKLEVYFER